MNWFNNLKISSKINIINASIIIITFLFFGSILLNNVYRSSYKEAQNRAIFESELATDTIEERFQTIIIQLQDLKEIILKVRTNHQEPRKDVIDMLNTFLEKNPDILGLTTAWEPDKFDGKDKEFVNKEFHDSTGRFIPYVVRVQENIIVEPVRDYDVSDWYLAAKKSKKLNITDPFYYPIADKEVMMFTITLPILDQSNNFIGMVSADIEIKDLQEIVKKINPLGAYSFIISDKGNYIAHSLRPELLGRSKEVFKFKYNEAVEANKLNKPFSYMDRSLSTGEKILRVFQPITFLDSNKIWSLCINVPKDQILADYYYYLHLIIIAIVVSVIILIFINISIFKSVISEPLFYIVDILNKLSKGNFDFSIEKNTSLDEIGELHRSAVLLQKDLSALITDLQVKEEELISQNEELQSAEEELIAQNEELITAEKELQKERNKLEKAVYDRTEELKKSLEHLEKANRHKSNFLSTMSHELRTPLNAIIDFSELLNKEYYGSLNDHQKEYVELILNSSSHLLELINDILDIAKIDSGTIEINNERINIHELIADINSLMSSQFKEKNIELNCYVDDKLQLILLDKRKFKQILINLLSNALKFTDENGKVDVKIVQISENKFKVSVKDSGIGVNQSEKDKIFDKFYQVTSNDYQSSKGIGLGLTIVKSFVTILGGEISLDSEENEGSNFWFILPLN
ncbi:MAG: sensor histidine kinase [Vampirovibrionia bacterium]